MPSESIQELRQQVVEASRFLDSEEEAGDGAVRPSATAVDPRWSEEWTFSFCSETRRGKVYAGKFTNRVLTTGESTQVASLAARILGGAAHEAVAPGARIVAGAIAHMSFSLWTRAAPGRAPEFGGPSWAKDLREILDQEVVLALWDKILEHENAFFRLEPDPGAGEKGA